LAQVAVDQRGVHLHELAPGRVVLVVAQADEQARPCRRCFRHSCPLLLLEQGRAKKLSPARLFSACAESKAASNHPGRFWQLIYLSLSGRELSWWQRAGGQGDRIG